MRAMVFKGAQSALELQEVEKPKPKAGQVLIKVGACGLCRTDLHIVDGELPHAKLPLIPGHQIVGVVEELGQGVKDIHVEDRVGVPWLGRSCGECKFCQTGRENLCDHALYTGYQIDGGLAEYCVADGHFIFPIPQNYDDLQAAPLLCGGLIGYRALRMTEGAKRIGFYGFGASAHILIQIVNHRGGEVYAFTRKDDEKTQRFAKKLGAVWAGGCETLPPAKLDAAIVFAPEGALIPQALRAVAKGGIVVAAGIHMSDIPSFPYEILWGERVVRSVANLTRADGIEFFELAPQIPIKTEINPYPLEMTNEALDDLRHGRFSGAAVISLN
ncbi:MAG: putative alcohol dehydrogenase AdhA [Chlamydiae bacterium]|nr:putative alcohol dehydrogenase AdhA [Chlamydiota bacterium]